MNDTTKTVPNWYVTPEGSGAKNGTSWSNAFASDNINLAVIKDGDIIWRKEVVSKLPV